MRLLRRVLIRSFVGSVSIVVLSVQTRIIVTQISLFTPDIVLVLRIFALIGPGPTLRH